MGCCYGREAYKTEKSSLKEWDDGSLYSFDIMVLLMGELVKYEGYLNLVLRQNDQRMDVVQNKGIFESSKHILAHVTVGLPTEMSNQ